MGSVQERIRILFVDDEPDVGWVFERSVRSLNYEVDVAISAGEAIERSRKSAYPVVVTDLHLRGLDGYAVIDALSTLNDETAFIITTGASTLPAANRMRSHAAVSSLITKPWNVEELATKLELAHRLHLRRSRAPRAPDHQKISVLIVEDSTTDALLLRHHLQAISGVVVTTATTLSAATMALHEQPFDVIFTDLSLPDARGVDTVFRLRSAGPGAAIVVCSGIEDQALMLQLIQLGAHHCIVKSMIDGASVAWALLQAKERKAFELRLVKMASYDPLTGVANRAGWNEYAAHALERSARRQDRIAIAMVDLDGFKQINDTWGHDAGDSLLQQVAGRLQRMVRQYDIVARLGGDEFALLFSDLGHDVDVGELGQRIQREISQPVNLRCGEQSAVGASIGISVFPENAETLPELVKAADVAMYQAKQLGKNRTVVAAGKASRSAAP